MQALLVNRFEDLGRAGKLGLAKACKDGVILVRQTHNKGVHNDENVELKSGLFRDTLFT